MADDDDDIDKYDPTEDEDTYDIDPKNYTTNELIQALGLKGTPSKEEVAQAVAQMKYKHAGDSALAKFFAAAGGIVTEALDKQKTVRPIVTRVINVDSFFRESLNSTTDSFLVSLSEDLIGVTALTLLSIEIPQTWYTFSAAKGTNAFVFQTLDVGEVTFTEEVVLPEGNYSNLSLLFVVQEALNAAMQNTQLYQTAQIGPGPWFTLVQDPINGLSTLTYADDPNLRTVKLTWYDTTYTALVSTSLNSNLGWEIGFRAPSTAIDPGTTAVTNALVTAASSTKYLIMKLDDHTSNRLTSNVVCVRTLPDQQIALPSYSAQATISRNSAQSVVALPTAPRRLTNAQLQSITKIASAPAALKGRADGGDTTNVFAKIPIKHQTDWANFANDVTKMKEDGPGKLIVEMGGTLQKNKRIYFGPVTISKLAVSIYDDHGNLLGLNNHDWSFTLEATFG